MSRRKTFKATEKMMKHYEYCSCGIDSSVSSVGDAIGSLQNLRTDLGEDMFKKFGFNPILNHLFRAMDNLILAGKKLDMDKRSSVFNEYDILSDEDDEDDEDYA